MKKINRIMILCLMLAGMFRTSISYAQATFKAGDLVVVEIKNPWKNNAVEYYKAKLLSITNAMKEFEYKDADGWVNKFNTSNPVMMSVAEAQSQKKTIMNPAYDGGVAATATPGPGSSNTSTGNAGSAGTGTASTSNTGQPGSGSTAGSAAPAKAFSLNQEVVAKTHDCIWIKGTYLGAEPKYAGYHKISFSEGGGSGTFYAQDKDMMSPADAQTKGIKTGAPETRFKSRELVFAQRNGSTKWEKASIDWIQFSCTGGPKYSVRFSGSGQSEDIENESRISSIKDAIGKGYWNMAAELPKMTLTDPTNTSLTWTGVGAGAVGATYSCVITYAAPFTNNAQAASLKAAPNTVGEGNLVAAVVRETNNARTNPAGVAADMEANPFKYIQSWDGMADLLDAVSYLKKAKPVGSLTASREMSLVNSGYVNWLQSNPNAAPHTGPGPNDGPATRLSKVTSAPVGASENIAFVSIPANQQSMTEAEANAKAFEIVYQLILDPGPGNAARRGHRVNIFGGQSITYQKL